MYGIVYCSLNTVNGKRYIGQTIRTLEKRKYFHLYESRHSRLNYHFYRSIREHGEDAFEWSVIDTANSREELIEKEKAWIQHYKTTEPSKGYNKTLGGEGFGTPTEEVRKSMGRDMQEGNNPFYQKQHTSEAKLKMSQFQKSRPRKSHSEETRRKMSEARKAYWKTKTNYL